MAQKPIPFAGGQHLAVLLHVVEHLTEDAHIIAGGTVVPIVHTADDAHPQDECNGHCTNDDPKCFHSVLPFFKPDHLAAMAFSLSANSSEGKIIP